VRWSELTGPTYQQLGHRDTIDWHYHDVPQLVYPSSGLLAISTALGTWIVPPQRAVWIPVRVAHAHQAHGPTQLRTLAFPASVDPLGLDNPALSDGQLIDAMMEHPILINRPIVVAPLGAKLCRPSELVLDILIDKQQGAFTKEDGERVVDDQGRRLI